MIPLTACEALGPQVVRVTATTRPSELEEKQEERRSGLYAVFGEEDGAFLGLVTERACARFPHRIFADLSAELRPPPVAAETSIEVVHTRMAAERVEALPVVDENGAFLGVITRPSLLEALLRRERELLAEAQCLQGQLEAEQKRLVAWSKRQEELNQASRALLGLVGQTTLQRELLQEAIRALAMLLQARYGAIGILDETEGLQQFIFTGLTAEEVDRIGAHPLGRGLLGVIIREDQALRLADVAKDPRYTGFPPYHPPMKTLLAVPISHQGKVYGRVYFCDKTTGEPFTEDDERLAVGFTRSLSLAFAHAQELAERTRAEEAVHEMNVALANAMPGISRMDPGGRYVNVNEAYARMIGYEPGEMIGMDWATTVYPDDRLNAITAYHRMSSEGKAEFEARAVRKDGAVFHKHVLMVKRVDEAGNFIGHYCFMKDITERKRIEEEFSKIHERFSGIYKSAKDAIGFATREGVLIDVNDSFSRLTGYSREELLGRRYQDITPEEYHEYEARIVDEVLRTGEPAEYQKEYVRKDGSRVPILLNVFVVRGIDDEPIGAAAIIKDITERNRAEATRQALYRASLQIQEPLALQERLVHLLETAQTVLELDRVNILLTDAEGQWLEAVASSGAEAPLAPLRVPTGPAGGSLAQAYLSREMVVWDGRGPVPEPWRLQPPYDQITAFRSRAFAVLPLVVQGRVIGVMGADRKYSRQPLEPATLELLQLFASQAALAIAQAQLFEEVRSGRERLRNLSRQLVEIQEVERRQIARELHDQIGQALTALNLALEMVARSRDGKSAAGLSEGQALVQDLITRVRDLSLDLRPAMLDDLGLLPALLWHFERYTALTNLHVVFKHVGAEEGLESEVETAAYRIVQEALTNVARHARVGHVTVRLWSDLGRLNVQIEDQGVGFDPKALLAVGTSSGLTGMRERAELLGGQLTVESAPGAGTRVTVELPLHPPVARGSGESHNHRADG